MTEIRVPTLGESVTEATIGRWFKKAGDAVAADEPLVELETDKVTIEVPAPSAGTLGEIVAKDGETVAVGALLGQIKDGAAGAAAKPAAAPALKKQGWVPRGPRQSRRRPLPSRPPLLSHRRPRPHRPPLRLRSRQRTRPRWRPRGANSPPRAGSMPPLFRARARMAALPRETCWRRSRKRHQPRPRSISPQPRCRCALPRQPTTPRAKSV